MNPELELNAYRALLDASFGIDLNANDFFALATADTVFVEDFLRPVALRLAGEHGYAGIKALMSAVRGEDPHRRWVDQLFLDAKASITPEEYDLISQQDFPGGRR